MRYLIGIDFGTTNCTLAYKEIDQSKIKQFSVPQLIAAGTENAEETLPSFLYFPLKEEVTQRSGYWIGKYAQQRGSEVPSQLVSSTKSWLCHSAIDRRAPLLPLLMEEASSKISPLQAASHLFLYLRESWNQLQPKDPLEKQQVLVTVPASFDPSARQLIVEAATLAGYPEIILLEEPQAAFYAWLEASGEEWRKGLQVGDHLLVIDIGGGTTDFTLISIADENGDLQLNRIAVGAHLLLGGDNMDLSLAYLAKSKFEKEGHEIDDWQMQAIVQACRQAKETLLGENPPDHCDITIMGRGSRLLGGMLKVSLQKEEVFALLIDGFFPLVSAQEQSKAELRLGIQQIGLPYSKDPRITCQLAKFLSQEGEGESSSTEKFIVPKAVLFNGGTTKSNAIRRRLMEQLNIWGKELGQGEVQELLHANYDFAVSRGAVYYGMARAGKGLRIRSGTSRSYYIGIEEALPAIPGLPTPLKAICVVPYGMEEGTEQVLADQKFALVLGETATFQFFSRSTEKLGDASIPVIGTVVKKWKQELTELPAVEAFLTKGEEDGKTVHVQLQSKVTELGVLELWCVADDGRKWKLEFANMREL